LGPAERLFRLGHKPGARAVQYSLDACTAQPAQQGFVSFGLRLLGCKPLCCPGCRPGNRPCVTRKVEQRHRGRPLCLSKRIAAEPCHHAEQRRIPQIQRSRKRSCRDADQTARFEQTSQLRDKVCRIVLLVYRAVESLRLRKREKAVALIGMFEFDRAIACEIGDELVTSTIYPAVVAFMPAGLAVGARFISSSCVQQSFRQTSFFDWQSANEIPARESEDARAGYQPSMEPHRPASSRPAPRRRAPAASSPGRCRFHD
jgi:hypothetical protein